MICVRLPPRTYLSTTSIRNPNNLPAPCTTKIDGTVSKLTDTEDGTEKQPEQWEGSACGTCSCERNYVQGPWYEYLKGSDHLCTQTHTHFINWFRKKCLVFTSTGFSRLKIGTSSGLWRKVCWTLGFHKMWGMRWLTEEIVGPWDLLWYVVLVVNIVR